MFQKKGKKNISYSTWPNFCLRQLAMNFTACECRMSFKASGLRSHQRQSLDIRCQTEHPRFDDCDMLEDMDFDPRSCLKNVLEDIPSSESTGAAYVDFEVDPAGDLFGDYKDYIPNESNISDDEGEDRVDDEEFILTENAEMLKPERLPPSESLLSCPLPDDPNDLNSDEMDLTTKNIRKALRLRGGAEEVLQKRPFVVKFTKGRAGATYTDEHVDGDNLNASYTRKVANVENLYSPFSSKLEWEIAHWAKMRGPSSTAFDELMKIKGVSIIRC